MTHKIYALGIIVIAFTLAFTGCETVSEEDSVKILSVTPAALIDGVEQQIAVAVEYNVSHVDQCRLIIAFNTSSSDVRLYRVSDSIDITQKGSGSHTFTVNVTPIDWSPHGEFQASVFLAGPDTGSSYKELAGDRKQLSLSHEYWSITWELNGGTETYESTYPERIAKGAVLAEPSPAPTKAGYIFGGWYTDSAFTQPYNFAVSVTADLTLYAKWREITIADLYGTWIGTETVGTYTLTISNNAVRWEDSQGGYVQYTNAALTPSIVQSEYRFYITGTRTASSGHAHISLTYVILQNNGQRVFLIGESILMYPQFYYKQP